MSKRTALAKKWRELADRVDEYADYLGRCDGSVKGAKRLLHARRVVGDLQMITLETEPEGWSA